MLRAPAFFSTTRATPTPAAGLLLATPDPACGWVLGALQVAEPHASHEAWARALMLHAYADEEPRVRSSGVVGPRPLLVDPLPARTGDALTLTFAVELRALLGALLGGWFVTVTAREHASAPVHVRLGAERPEALGEPTTPAEAAIVARACLRAGQVERADALFTTALADEAAKSDLNAGVLYDAACAAARAAHGAAEPAARHAAGARALTLLREDLQRRQRALATRTQQHCLAALDGAPDGLDGLIAQEVEHLRWARDEDPDLAHLRSSSAFRTIFRSRAAGATGRV